MDQILMSKAKLRQQYQHLRAEMRLEESQQASEAICTVIKNWIHYLKAETILTYLPMRKEVDLTYLILNNPMAVWAIPRIQPNGEMRFHLYDPDHLVRHRFGMLEPAEVCPLISSSEIQLALVPGLVYDRAGWRLGYGGGYYDRFLSEFGGISGGVTYQDFLIETVPHDSYDIPVQYVITDGGITKVS